MSQAKKIKKILSQWEQVNVKKVVDAEDESIVKEKTFHVKPKMEEYLVNKK